MTASQRTIQIQTETAEIVQRCLGLPSFTPRLPEIDDQARTTKSVGSRRSADDNKLAVRAVRCCVTV